MRMFFSSVVGFSLLVGGVHAEVKHEVKVKEVKVLVQQTPQFQIAGPREKRVDPRYWMEIEAELEVQTAGKRGVIPFIDELQATWYAVIQDELGVKKMPVMLKGSSKYRLVRTTEGKVLLSAYIDPDVLQSLTGKERPSESDLMAFAVVVSGTDVATEGKYAKGLYKAEGDGDKKKWWEDWKRETKGDFIVPKSKTPFAPLWTDLYPIEKVE